jgi:uracil-DNA glycosylase
MSTRGSCNSRPSDRIAPLERWRAELAAGGRAVPRFDPRDGGVDAKVLILLETPGAGMTGEDVVSRDNPGGTARNFLKFVHMAELAREDSVLWNVVPWVVHAPSAKNRPLRRSELREGLATIPALLDLLPCLRAAVLLGRAAAQAEPVIRKTRPDLPVFTAPHPSPTIVCTHPSVGERIVATLRAAAAEVHAGPIPACAGVTGMG